MAAVPGAALRALRNRNFRLFFAGQGVSLIGTWITRLATSWLIYRLTDSALLLGVVGFCGQIPTLLLAPLAGVYVDRWNRHRVLLVTQALSLAQAAALGVLTLTGRISIADVIGLQILQGIINAFDTPARQAFIVNMVEDRHDLPNAIALNSALVTGSRIAGPALGGGLIAAVGEGWCFIADAASYVAVIASLLAMRLPPHQPPAATSPVLRELVAGYRYVVSFPPIRGALMVVASVSLFGMPWSVLMPVIASDVLGGGSHTLGWLMAVSGAGALAGAVYLASRPSVVGLGRAIAANTVVFGAATAAFALSSDLIVSLIASAVVGVSFMITLGATNTVIQTIVPEELRGRVMAFYTMAFLGTAPLGSLAAGVAADWLGAPVTILSGALFCVVTGVWFVAKVGELRKYVRPIYIELGILTVPDLDTGAKTL